MNDAIYLLAHASAARISSSSIAKRLVVVVYMCDVYLSMKEGMMMSAVR